MKKVIRFLFLFVVALMLVWFLGPQADYEQVSPDLPQLSFQLTELDEYLARKEAGFPKIKPENESRIVWADSVRQTEYALVYLHGFSASPMEGAPLHQTIAQRYGMNLYLPRLSKHGMADDEIFAELTPKGLMNSAKEALVIGKKIGKKVILMSCSTGGTLGIYLSAHHPDIYAHLMYSPNIDLFDGTTDMLTGPWGLQIVKQILGDYNIPKKKKDVSDSVLQLSRRYWSGKYRVEGLVALQALLDQTMTEEIHLMVNQPYFLGFYFKNEAAQDSTVSVEAMRIFDARTGTPDDMKKVVAFPDAKSHVINSTITSKQYEGVLEATADYIENILKIEPIN